MNRFRIVRPPFKGASKIPNSDMPEHKARIERYARQEASGLEIVHESRGDCWSNETPEQERTRRAQRESDAKDRIVR
jgi:hypothetical protein